MREILMEELQDVAISISSEIMPEIFEHERFSTTVANAVLAPVVGSYGKGLSERMAKGGYKEDVLLLHSGGGVMTAKTAEKFAARLAASGIAAGAIASRHVAQLAGFENSIGLDMGGTSTDVSLCDRGNLRITKDWHVEYGYPICFPSIEVLTIGAGGGSLAWLDDAGSLRNGPQSAGSNPGPACYERGGTNATNSDANVVLGRLGSELAGGTVKLNKELATQAVQRGVAEPLGLSLMEAATAVIKVANANMADAVRLISIRRGYDPRDFALVAFGGAGPLHGAALAKDLSIPDCADTAQSRRDVGTGLSAGRYQARHLEHVPQQCEGRRSDGRRAHVPVARGRRARPPGARRRPRGPHAVPALHRHALSRPVALDGGAGQCADPLARRGDGDVPRRARTRAQLQAHRRAGRGVSPERVRYGPHAQGAVREA